MDAAIMLGIIALAAQLTVSSTQTSQDTCGYLPVCTGSHITASRVSGEFIILGYNHLGKSAFVFTINATTPTPDSSTMSFQPHTQRITQHGNNPIEIKNNFTTSYDCSCEINATAKFNATVMTIPTSKSAAIWLQTGNSSKKLIERQASSVVSENTSHSPFTAYLKIKTSSSTESFLLLIEILSYGNITVRCTKGKEDKTKSQGHVIGVEPDQTSERPLTEGQLGTATVAGELVAGIVLLTIAVLVLLAAMLFWGRIYYTKYMEKNGTQKEKKSEFIPMKKLSHYEEMEDSETGYYRYSDPLDHRTTLMNSSQLALDKVHIVLHHPELTSAGTSPTKSSTMAGTRVTSPTSIPETSRHLAEIVVENLRNDEDEESDIYEEYSNVVVKNEDEEQHQREEALSEMLDEEQQYQHSPAQPTARMEPPVVIRVHRKESDNKKSCDVPIQISSQPDQSSLSDQYVYFNDKNLNVDCDPLLSRPFEHSKNLVDFVDNIGHSGQKSETEDSVLNKSASSLPEENQTYVNALMVQDFITTGDADIDRSDNVLATLINRTNNTANSEKPSEKTFINDQQVPSKDLDLKTCHLTSTRPLIRVQSQLDENPNLNKCGRGSNEQSVTDNDHSLETYGLASAKPLDCEQSATTNDTDLETYGLASAKPLDYEQSVTTNDPDLETYGLASAKTLDCEQLVTKNDPDFETYGLASAKPLDCEQSVTTNDPDLETYGLASAKPLDYEQSVTTNDPDLETYGLASAKTLDCEQSVNTKDSDLETYGLASAKPLDCEQSVTTKDSDLETYGLASAKPLDCEQSVTTNDPDLETYGLASEKPLDYEQSVTTNDDTDIELYSMASAKPLDYEQSVTTTDPDLETYGLASAKPLDCEQSVTTNDPDLETYGLASAKPLDYEQSVTTNDPDLETYGLASAKPLDYEQSVTTNDPDLETYGLASAKPLDYEQSVTTNDPDLETYGLASAKPLDYEQSVTTNDPDLETYGLASAKTLDYEQSVTTNDPDLEIYGLASAKTLDCEQSVNTKDSDLETYGLASAKPLDCEQSVTTNDPDLETYSLASAKPLDCEQSVTTNVPLPVGFLINASNNPESGPDRHPAGSPECSNNEVKLKDLILQSPNNNSLLTTTSSSFSQRKNPLPDASAPQILDGGNSTTHRMPRSPSADSTPQPKRNIPTREDTEDNIYGNLVPSDTATTETAMKNTSPTPPNQNDVPNEENDDEVDANESEHVYESYSELVGCELEKFRADGNIRSWSESSPRCQDSSPERFDSEVCNTDGGLDLRTSNVYTDLEEED
ncbi:hypothetical protein RRG08_023198 [Elysia crispata]|uniref:Uncharacterized protein n=1 Tax=Elysia crispata TaxID=231223 RepID=A0AAE1DJV3_9GAST|nr:hypothetical protein RRG08_023198 [Elysia crispata]